MKIYIILIFLSSFFLSCGRVCITCYYLTTEQHEKKSCAENKEKARKNAKEYFIEDLKLTTFDEGSFYCEE